MKKILTLFLLFVITNTVFAINNPEYVSPRDISLEMFLMRKGTTVSIVLMSNGSKLPSQIIIERKSTAPLSKYRKIILLDNELIEQFKADGQILLIDEYPESRQLDSYYRIVYATEDGVLRTLPGIFLSKVSGDIGVTFGDHKQDARMFDPIVRVEPATYEKFGVNFKVERVDVKVLLTLSSDQNKLEGEWSIERKSSKPLASFRKVKTIYGEDLEAIFKGEKVFLDKYPESRQLDSYYRLVVTNKDGEKTEFPSLFLQGDHAK